MFHNLWTIIPQTILISPLYSSFLFLASKLLEVELWNRMV